MPASPSLAERAEAPAAVDVPSFHDLGAAVSWPEAVDRPTPAGAGAGRIAELAEWLAAAQAVWPPQPLRRPCLVAAGSCSPAVEALAERTGTRVRSLRSPGDPMTAFAAGAAVADAEIESGTDIVVLALGGSDDDAEDDARTAAGVVVSLLTGAEPVALLPRGPAALDTAAWVEQAGRLRDGRRRTADLRGRPDALLSTVGSRSFAAAAGVLLQAAVRRTPVILDGTPAVAAALLCADHHGSVARWLQVADSSPDPVHTRAAADLRLEPVLALGTTSGDGTAGLLALELLAGAAATAAADPRDPSDTA